MKCRRALPAPLGFNWAKVPPAAVPTAFLKHHRTLKPSKPHRLCGLDPQSLNHFRKHDGTKVHITIENLSLICPIAPIISLYHQAAAVMVFAMLGL
ncbi:MAG: hypothetical protein IKH52_02085 [Bacteroidaceae bacterium]|nr:hypothetical protein [Bacteroidaceae bacterium]